MPKPNAKPKGKKLDSKAIPAKIVERDEPERTLMAGQGTRGPGSIAPKSNPRVILVQPTAAGSSGQKIFAGYFAEEYLTNELHGTAAADMYDKMRRSDAKIKMCLNAVKTPIIAANWEVVPGIPDDEESKFQAEFIEHVLFKDMDKPFSKTEALSLADFGHSVFEITHKPVMNHEKFGDYVGLRSLGWRSPRSILYWRLNPEDGSVNHIHQLISGDLERYVDIPGQFLVVNSLEKEGDLYEGVSLLRPAYGAYKRKNLYLKIAAIGLERNAVPTPTAEVPAGKEKTTQYANLIASLQNYTSHENSFLVYPAGWKIDTLKNNFEPEKVKSMIEFENVEITGAFLANFLSLGQTSSGSGSRAVSMDQSEFFMGAIQYVADEAVSGFNHKMIPELIKMKFGPQEAYPTIKITGISDRAGVEMAQSLKFLCEAQVIQPDDALEEHVRRRYTWPKKSDKGVRIVQAPKSMQQGDNVHETDNPEKHEGPPTKLTESLSRPAARAKKRRRVAA